MKNIRPYKDKHPKLSDSSYVDPMAVITGDIELAENTSIWPFVVARGDVNYIRIGKNSNVQDNSVLHVSRQSAVNPDGFPLIIGEDVSIGHSCTLHGCTIGNRVMVGIGAIVLDGVVVEDDVLIAAGTLVPPRKRLESGYLYMGNPAKKARPLKESEVSYLNKTASKYVELKNDYLAGME
ncbi:MAG: gamma carbonic anhydrase family protein [Thalassotalea sp.]|nr:gamma carbonic anhydrase family protein [Thalassotalea sp.]